MINRLFIGNFQVPLLKKWVEKDEEVNNQVLPSQELVVTHIRKRMDAA